MNKSELIEAVGKTAQLAKRDAENAVNAMLHTIVSEVKAGRRVSLVGFGAFKQTRRAARTGRNPQTGAAVRIPASKGISFSPSVALKQVVNGKAPLKAPKLSLPAGSTTTRATRGTAKATASKAAATKATASKRTAAAASAGRTTRKAAATKATASKRTTTRATAKKAVARKTVSRPAAAARVAARPTARRSGTTSGRGTRRG
ncbi:HU family DNA-binding protein [Aciditerrimonas ferrireducens]|uniref:HU family DNA-binding protein n=1 Tax=Aciditerrimonas ferrireducens TaxID=667306 RepID=A0ABV6C4D2_9ACTN